MIDKRIEYPSVGQTYVHMEYGVYKYDEYPSYSVLAGEERRSFLGSYPTLAEAQAAHPDAVWNDNGSHYVEHNLNHLSAGGENEPWRDEY